MWKVQARELRQEGSSELLELKGLGELEGETHRKLRQTGRQGVDKERIPNQQEPVLPGNVFPRS